MMANTPIDFSWPGPVSAVLRYRRRYDPSPSPLPASPEHTWPSSSWGKVDHDRPAVCSSVRRAGRLAKASVIYGAASAVRALTR